jgi:hypothetical protein
MPKRSAIGQRLILASVLAVGFMVVWGVLGGWATEILTQHFRPAKPSEQLLFTPEAMPVLLTRYQNDEEPPEYRDLQGNPLSITDDRPDRRKWAVGTFLPAKTPTAPLKTEGLSQDIASGADNQFPVNYWFLMMTDKPCGSAYLVGYNSKTNARVGFLGKDGFQKEVLPPDKRFALSCSPSHLHFRVIGQQFRRGDGARYPSSQYVKIKAGQIPPWFVYLYADDGKLYQIDLDKRTVRDVLSHLTIRSAAVPAPFANLAVAEPGDHRLLVRTEEAILVLDSENQVLRQFQIPEELRDQGFSWFDTPAGESVAYQEHSPTRDYEWRVQCWWSDAGGHITHREDSPVKRKEADHPGKAIYGAVLPGPVLTDVLVGILVPCQDLMFHQTATYSNALRHSLADSWPCLAVVHILAVPFAWLCFRRQARYGASKGERIVWPLFVFAFGVAGWVGFRFGRSWPVLERCPACNTAVPQDREACAACEIAFPEPVLRGTEIFA